MDVEKKNWIQMVCCVPFLQHAGEIKTNMQKVKWQILNDEYVHFPHDLKASIHLDAIRLKDKMNSKHLRMICSAQLSQYLFQKANTKAGDEKRDYQNLSTFLLKLSTYLMVFSPSNNLDNATLNFSLEIVNMQK
jgi:hypothetical protein